MGQLYSLLSHAISPNPFVYSIEAISSEDSKLLDQPNGAYQLRVGLPPQHLDSLYIAARIEFKKSGSRRDPILFVSRDELIEHYYRLYEESPKNSTSDDNSRVRQTVIDKVPEFPRAPLESLSPTTISKMVLNEAHQGKYLIVRAVSRAVRLIAIQVLVEDREGSVVDMALYNCLETSGLDREGILELIPFGQILLIREPWLTRGRTGGHITVRVDSPTDITFLPPVNAYMDQFPEGWKMGYPRDAEVYKDIGNRAFKSGRFESAIRAYSDGLSVDPSASLLRLNRSICYLSINKPSMAIQDARIASEDEALTETLRSKARYRMAQAYYQLDRFKEALSILEDKNKTRFSPKEFSELEKKTRQRLVEQVQGNYNWFSLNKIANQINGRRPIPDVADYVGPVKVAQMDAIGGGRGLFTTRDVLAGELLLVSKPFAFATSVDYPELSRVFHTRSGVSLERANFELVGRAIQHLIGDHSAASALFLDLYSNTAVTKNSSVANTLPSFLTTGDRYWDIPGEHPIRDINVNHVEEILFSNNFNVGMVNTAYGKSEAVYLLPSMVNHACHGTAIRTPVGSIMVMRASRDLKSGEEITSSYVGSEDVGTYIRRGAALKKWNIVCRCDLCLADQEDGVFNCRAREGYEEELKVLQMGIRPGGPELVKITQELVTKIRSTYKEGRTMPMDTLGVAQRCLAFAQYAGNPNSVISLQTDVLRSHGIHVKDTPPKKVPRNRSQLHRGSLIIGTGSFPSQPGLLFLCIKIMETLVRLEMERGDMLLASHWVVACLWVHETFFGHGKKYLWHSLNVVPIVGEPFVEFLKGFE